MAFDSNIGIGIAIGATVGATVGRAFESVTDRSRRVGDALGRANKRADRHRQELRRLRAEQARTGDESGKLARDIQRVGEKLQRTTRHAQEYRRELRGAQRLEGARTGRDRALRQGAVAIGGAYAAGRLLAGSFERERAQLRLGSLLEGPGGAVQLRRGMAHSRADVRRGRVLQGEAELLQVQADLRGADLSAEVARIGSTLSARIATVTQGSARDVASVLGGAYTLFGDQFEGDTTERLGRIGELLTATQKKYKFTVFGDLGAGLKLAAAGAKSANLPLDQTAVALGLLSKAELAGERGGTALSAVLRQLSTKEVARFGVQIARSADGSLDLVATLANLKERLDRIGDTDVRNRTVQEMFGDEGARGLVPLLDQLGAFEEGLAGVRNPIENIDQAHQRWLDSASGKSAILRNNLTSLRDTIATGLVPAVEPLIGLATGAAVEIGAMAERTPRLASGLQMAAGAVGAFVGASLLVRGGRWAVLQLIDSYKTTVDVAGRAGRAAARFGLAT
ncbi:MAG: phage tail tape measure protein, partial [Acidobacteria bacterium]|nr:phage tail tape measure protein [Acidobacteriota bacterium]